MNPQLKTFFLGILTTGLVFLICFKSCKPEIKPSDKSKLITKANTQENKIKAEEAKATVLHDTITKLVIRYRTIRHDSLIPCETKLIICDTILVKDSTLIAAKDSIISHYGVLVSDWKQVHSSDSTDLVNANKEVKKQKRKVIFWKVVSATGAVILGYQGVRN